MKADDYAAAMVDAARSFLDRRHMVLRGLRCLAGREPWIRNDIRITRRRLGRGDGMWTIAPTAIEHHGVVYSFGVGTNIDLDLELIRRFDVSVHAFDPTPISREWLATQRPPSRFHFHPLGLGDRDGEALFELPQSHGVSFTCRSDMLREPSKQSCTGQIRRLETLLEELGHDRLTLLKIDIEGSEYDVIGDVAALSGRIDQLLVEFHHRMSGTRDAVRLTTDALRQLRAAGYRVFNVSARGFEISLLGPRAIRSTASSRAT